MCLTGAAFAKSTIAGNTTTVQVGGTLVADALCVVRAQRGGTHVGIRVGWTSPGNVYAAGYATTTVPASGASATLDVTDWGGRSSAAANATPVGIQVQITGLASAAGALTPTVQLLKNGDPGGRREDRSATLGTTLAGAPQIGRGDGHPRDLGLDCSPATTSPRAASAPGSCSPTRRGAPVQASVDVVNITV